MADPSGFRKQADTPVEVQSRFLLKKRLGKGSYGTVYEADDTVTGQKVALKCVEGVFNTVVDAKRTLREITILRQSVHINIVGCVTVLKPPNPAAFTNLWVVLDVCKWDLAKVMRLSKSFKGWSDQHVKFILYQALCGMNYLHGANIVHRDLKPSNLLVTEKCEIRICDFVSAAVRHLLRTRYASRAICSPHNDGILRLGGRAKDTSRGLSRAPLFRPGPFARDQVKGRWAATDGAPACPLSACVVLHPRKSCHSICTRAPEQSLHMNSALNRRGCVCSARKLRSTWPVVGCLRDCRRS